MSEPVGYEAAVIGSGQGGKPLALALAQAGRRTVLVERDHVGGSCVNYGCTPTKTMAASARVAYLSRRALEYGVQAGPVRVDLKAVKARKTRLVESFRNGSLEGIQKTPGLELLRGEARFLEPHLLEVRRKEEASLRIEAEWMFLNPGCRPSVPPIDGLEQVPFLDSTSVMELESVPQHLLVVGGGYVGIEFGQMFSRFGSRVTLLQRGPQLLPREDQDVAEEVAKILREDGIEIHLQTEVRQVREVSPGHLELVAERNGEGHLLHGSHLLIATGRTPNTDTLDLPSAGIQTDDRGYIRVNERLETGVPGVYALGDVKGGPAFTHISYDDFRVLRTNLLEGGDADISGRLVPYTVFMDPQLGGVGLTEKEARRQGRPVQVARLPMTRVARALETGETRGFMKALVDPETKQILGCTILGIEGGEIMAVLQVAMMGKLPYPSIREAVFAHPTLAESLNNLFMTLD